MTTAGAPLEGGTKRIVMAEMEGNVGMIADRRLLEEGTMILPHPDGGLPRGTLGSSKRMETIGVEVMGTAGDKMVFGVQYGTPYGEMIPKENRNRVMTNSE